MLRLLMVLSFMAILLLEPLFISAVCIEKHTEVVPVSVPHGQSLPAGTFWQAIDRTMKIK